MQGFMRNQLCYKYNADVALCPVKLYSIQSSGAMFAAICNDFSWVIFSQP